MARLIIAVLVFSVAAHADAQVVNQQQAVQGGAPARDQRAAPRTGTAAIRGRIFAADTGRPLRRARISVSAPELGQEGRTTSTNPDGRYEIKDLPAGRYNLTVNRNGYIQLRYGQRRPLEQGKPLQLADRQVIENVDFSLPRMSLITGRVFDEAAEAISGVSVMALRSMYFEGRRRLVPAGPMVQTDDAGQYRLLGLVPGTYYVMAFTRETWTVTEGGVETTFGYSPTYVGGTVSAGDAKRITVGIGQEAASSDLSLIPGRAANISGTAVDSHGQPLAGRGVSLVQEFRSPNASSMFSSSGATVNPDGSFTIKNVTPGEYKLTVAGSTQGKPNPFGPTPESAAVPIAVAGVDIDNVSLVTSAGWSVSGQVTSDGGAPLNVARERLLINSRTLQPDFQPRTGNPNPDSGRVKDDWTFVVSNLFGQIVLRPNVPDPWVLKAILHNGRDITDAPLEMKSGEELSGVEVVLTTRQTMLTGQLTDERGGAAIDGTVIVFATDAEKWTESSRFVRTARPDQQGQYQIRGLPTGEYLAVAMEYVQEGLWNDPEFLESVRRYGQRITLAEGASQTVALKLVAAVP